MMEHDFTMVCEVLLAAGWRSAEELTHMSPDDMRNTLIVELSKHSTDSIPSLQRQSSVELAWHGLMYLWLIEAKIRMPLQLADMSLDNHRNTTIVENHNQTKKSISSLQALNNWELTEMAYEWWLPAHLQPLIDKLEDVKGASIVKFTLKDDGGRTMDCLKVLQLEEGCYLGIYHTHSTVERYFQLQVAESRDLKTWNRIAVLGNHAHQGDIDHMGSGFLVVNEHDIPGNGNNMQFRYYESLAKLKANEPIADKHIKRTFSSAAEGTPNIHSIVGTSPERSVILLGFHYYKDQDVDQDVDRLAAGVFVNFSQWTPWVACIANQAIEEMGFRGNIGGRYTFEWNDVTWFVQEAQRIRHEWHTWRVLLGNGRFYTQCNLETYGGSKAFANPSVTKLSGNRYVATDFVPVEDNAPCEAGELLYVFNLGN